jgi:2-haloacid dehalogenase
MIDTVVFDMGGVLVDWDPRHIYRTLLPDDAAIDAFFGRVPLFERNYRDNDRGVPIASTVDELCALHPDDEHLIRAWGEHYPTMARRVYDDVVEIVAELHARGLRLLALSNAPLEMEATWRAFDFCRYFEGFVISGEEGVVKPEPAIFQVLIDRFRVDPASTVFVDDVQHNVDAANALGFNSIRFASAEQLRRELDALLP